MKQLIIVVALATLAGCATPQPGPANYGTRAYDPNGWQTVSVTPVPFGTGASAAAAGQTGVTTGDYAAQPSTTTVAPQSTYVAPPMYAPAPTYVAPPVYAPGPVYVTPPVYAAAPVYAAPPPYYWWPPISIGLGFNWNHWSGGHGGGWHGGGWHGGGGGWHGGGGGWHGGGGGHR
jgi:uncharacterized membrane protein YgcG